MNEPDRLPRCVEEVTPQWLTRALQTSHPGVCVKSLEVERILWGTATKLLVKAQYDVGSDVPGLPAHLCIKGEFDERSRQVLDGMVVTGTEVEAEFFNDLAPRLGLPLPRHWYGGSEPGMGILVLDNLSVQGYQFGDPTRHWPAERVAQSLDILAKLHASTWNRRFPEYRWLKPGAAVVRNAAETLMSTAHWQGHFVKPGVFQLPAALADNQRLINAYRALWRYDDAHAEWVVHGDAHVANTCIDPSGQPFFIDWAAPCYSHWGTDVPYFLIGALSVEDRRAHEAGLFAHYLSRLAFHGGPQLDRGEAWEAYRQHVVHAMMWATLPPELQPLEYVHAMGERYCSAMIEHDTLRLLGV